MNEQIGPYHFLHAIGAGGSARVDLARIDRVYGFQRHVVIKRPLEHLRADPRANESLRREARLGGRLRHPNLVSVLDAGVHDGYDYIVLDYIHGGSLRTLIQSDEPARIRDVPLEVALTIVRDVARGLHEAHELEDEGGSPLGLVHRDVSPGNVLIGLDGAVQLADFGIAKETSITTVSGSMTGTVTYMAPEQCRGQALDRRADVFSLGVILYELLTGHRLFWADNDVASLHRVLAGKIARPREVVASVPAALDDLVMAALAPDREQRLPTALAIVDAIEAFAAPTLVLAARQVAHWVVDVIGPRDQPWIGEPTVFEDAPFADAIESAPLVDVIRAERPRRFRRALPMALAGALGGAGIMTALVVHRADDVVVAAPVPPPAIPIVHPVEQATPAPAPVPAVAPGTVTTNEPKARPKGKDPVKASPAKPAAPRPARAKASAPPTAWDEQMLFPTEAGSGTKHK